MLASFIEKLFPGAKKAQIYRALPPNANHREVALASISAEGKDSEKLRLELLRRFPEDRASIDTLIDGYREFAKTGVTSPNAYYAFRYLYWKTAGESNALIGKHISSAFPKQPLPKSVASIFGDFTDADVRKIVDGVLRDGVYGLEQKLPPEVVQELVEGMSREAEANRGPEYFKPDSDRTTYLEVELLKTKAMMRIVTDPLLYFVASEYLDAQPVMAYPTAWISRPHANSKETLSERAQLFHADMSNPGFIKAFIYLNDVSETNGPHCVVPRTHQKKASPLWRDERIEDEEMAGHYPRETWQAQTGGAGSIFFVDTSGFHKGMPLLDGYRHLAQFYLVNTLFGEHVPLSEEAPAFDPSKFGNDVHGYSSRYLARLAIGADA